MNSAWIPSSIGRFVIVPLLAMAIPGSVAGTGVYEQRIKPLLKERCYACHGALEQKSGLRVDTVRSLLEAGVVVPGKVTASELVRRVTSSDEEERMPPEGHALTRSQIVAITDWIADGAPAPENEKAEEDPLEHWSFRKVEKPSVPRIDGASHPVDAFLLAKLEERGIRPQLPAERSLALRRLHLDLTGLPPTREQLLDDRPWETIVDELLASPHHGERWARHWMDVWRYSDWYGLGAQLRYSQKHLWHWREWIVESLNDDRGYDRMIREMLAGDEIAPADPDVVRATGFLARNYYLFNRTTWLDNTIEHVGKAFLGLTLNCAKCHDHKYDPIEMVDYYNFRAIFEPHQVRLDPVPGEADLDRNGLPRAFDDDLEAVTWLHLRGDPKQPDKETEIVPAVPAFLSGFAPPVTEVALPLSAYAPGSRGYAREALLERAEKRLAEAEKKLARAIEDSKKEIEPGVTKNAPAAGEKSFVPIREDFSSLDSAVWRLEGEGLEFRNGALEQVAASRSPGQLITRRPLPRDFEMTCRYTTTGGPTYRSVTFRFDRDAEGGNANFIYTSEHAPGPKVQAAYTRSGKTSYPSDGRAGKVPLVGKPQELRFAVRGELANVWLDGKFVLAYRFPERLESGLFSLSAFDATAVFHSLEIRPLSEDLTLTEAKNGRGKAPGNGKEKREAAKLARQAALAELASLKATIEADRFRHTHPGENDAGLEEKAARAQAEAMIARAEADLAAGDAGKRKAAAAAKKKGEKTLEDLAKGQVTYEPLDVSRQALETPEHKFEDYPAEFPSRSTGRRTMLAEWITSPENPLTARVAVNHVWMRHFGEPLVESVFDFGRQAKRPLHAELLDFLAAEFMESGWSFRHLHRLLVTSDAYRRTSSIAGADLAAVDRDPANRFYWRMNPRRMESQVVRDSLLQLAGTLDLTIGGPSVDAKSGSTRRSLYFTHSPDKLDRFLTKFDEADLLQCYRRSESVVPQQALALSNSRLSLESAGKIAEGVGKREPADRFVEGSFFLLLGRNPGADERAECLRFLDEVKAVIPSGDAAAKEMRARGRLVHALLNHNDFVTIR